MKPKNHISCVCAAALLALLAGCARTYPRRLIPVRRHSLDDPARAIETLEKTRLSGEERNRLLYHLEAGVLYHLAGEYEMSNRFLESAEWISDEMYTRSLTREAASLLTSDNLLPYRGEYYDYLFINYYKLLNYLHIGCAESALVEVRRINYKMSLFNKEDAFLSWLTAILHRHTGNSSSAFIEYMKAYRTFKNRYPEKYGIGVPDGLLRDIAAFCYEADPPRAEEFPESVRRSFVPPEKYGSAVFIIETGFVPYKYETRVEASIPQRYRDENKEVFSGVYHLTVSLPEYSPREEKAEKVSLKINGSLRQVELVEDIGAMAVSYFNADRANVLSRTVMRAAAKYAAYRSVRGKDRDNTLRRILGASVDIVGSATERADTRSWLMLPDRIFMSREYLKPGEHEFEVAIYSSGNREKTVTEEFVLEEGELKFIVLRRS